MLCIVNGITRVSIGGIEYETEDHYLEIPDDVYPKVVHHPNIRAATSAELAALARIKAEKLQAEEKQKAEAEKKAVEEAAKVEAAKKAAEEAAKAEAAKKAAAVKKAAEEKAKLAAEQQAAERTEQQAGAGNGGK